MFHSAINCEQWDIAELKLRCEKGGSMDRETHAECACTGTLRPYHLWYITNLGEYRNTTSLLLSLQS